MNKSVRALLRRRCLPPHPRVRWSLLRGLIHINETGIIGVNENQGLTVLYSREARRDQTGAVSREAKVQCRPRLKHKGLCYPVLQRVLRLA